MLIWMKILYKQIILEIYKSYNNLNNSLLFKIVFNYMLIIIRLKLINNKFYNNYNNL